MSMTKFTSKNDPGYVNVCDVLWLWISEIGKNGDKPTQKDSPTNAPAGNGLVSSGGGAVFIGSNNAGRDITNIRMGG